MKFIEAIAIGIQKANDAERIEKEIVGILLKFNQDFIDFTASKCVPFNVVNGVFKGYSFNCPIKIEIKNFSWPMNIICGNQILEVVGVQEFGLALGVVASSAIFGDYVKAAMLAVPPEETVAESQM